jgi:hypothetical protein
MVTDMGFMHLKIGEHLARELHRRHDVDLWNVEPLRPAQYSVSRVK